MEHKFDLAVIGAGPGGYVAAIRAAQLGKKVAIIEANHLGGICLNWGCIPTKSLLRSAEILHLIRDAKDYGLSVGEVSVSLKEIVARSRNIAKQLSNGIAGLMKKNKIEVFNGFASFISSSKIQVKANGDSNGDSIIEAKNFIIATGARARVIKDFEADGKNLLTYKEAMVLDEIPDKLLIVGSGAIGIEFASFYRTLGSEVTILEVQDRILPVEDKDISEFARKAFEKQGHIIHTSVKINSIKSQGSFVDASFTAADKNHSAKFDKAIIAVGVMPNTEKIGLDKTKVTMDEKSYIKVNERLQTSDPNIYAIGDVTEGPWLAHKASHEAIIAAENIAGLKTKPIDRRQIPGCTYSMPQVASIGLTEAKAKEAGYKLKIGKFPFQANGKALALGEADGFIKIMFDEKTGEILGAHMIGAEVTELINSIAVAMRLEATEEDLFHTIFPHPTLSEMIHESALAAFGRAIHI